MLCAFYNNLQNTIFNKTKKLLKYPQGLNQRATRDFVIVLLFFLALSIKGCFVEKAESTE